MDRFLDYLSLQTIFKALQNSCRDIIRFWHWMHRDQQVEKYIVNPILFLLSYHTWSFCWMPSSSLRKGTKDCNVFLWNIVELGHREYSNSTSVKVSPKVILKFRKFHEIQNVRFLVSLNHTIFSLFNFFFACIRAFYRKIECCSYFVLLCNVLSLRRKKKSYIEENSWLIVKLSFFLFLSPNGSS